MKAIFEGIWNMTPWALLGVLAAALLGISLVTGLAYWLGARKMDRDFERRTKSMREKSALWAKQQEREMERWKNR